MQDRFLKDSVLKWTGAFVAVFFSFIAFVLVVSGGGQGSGAYASLCARVASRIYLDTAKTEAWADRCYRRAAQMGPSVRSEVVVDDIRGLFAELKVSHLELYNAGEVGRIWEGRDESTGIDSEFVEGELVVFDVASESPAAEAGLRRGDVIVRIQGAHPAPSLAASLGGDFEIRRGDRFFMATLEPRMIRLDENPRVAREGSRAVLRVPSFRAEFFQKDEWRTLVRGLAGVERLVVDLRGNSGGNFVAGLRFLSPFMCGRQELGYLLKPKTGRVTQEFLTDDLADANQLSIMDRADMVSMRTFDDYGCLTARVSVLIDSRTASTAEMAAQALRDYLDARVLGVSSSGQLLVGVWYDVPELGEGWRISIPEAVYQTRRGRRLEGGGVRVDRELYYDLKSLQASRDPWIETAMADLRAPAAVGGIVRRKAPAKGLDGVPPDSPGPVSR